MFSRFPALVVAVAAALLTGPLIARAQTTAFTYQGRLTDTGAPASGTYDFQVFVYDAASGGNVVSGPLLFLFTPVTNGLFILTPDFGNGVFTGPNRWLEIGVRVSGGNGFVTLGARQQITPAPYALYAPSAGTVSGVLAVSNLPAGVALLNGNQTFTGTVQFANPSNTYSGNFTGNGSGVTNLPFAALNTGGTITWTGAFRLASSPATGNQPTGLAVGDFNGDGRPDLACVNFTDGTVMTFTNNGSGGFAPASTNTLGAGAQPIAVAVADVNGDGRPDLITANSGNSTLSVLTNNGSGGFVLATNLGSVTTPYHVVAADINGDGRPDLIAANIGATTLTVFTNNGAGGFVLASQPNAGAVQIAVAVADVNGDGRPDLISANYNAGTLSVLTNKGGGQFALLNSPVVGANPRDVVVADFDGNGRPDLACVNFGANTLMVLTNNGSGAFTLASTYNTSASPASLIATNLTGNGRMDLICANEGGNTLLVLTNGDSNVFGLASLPAVGVNPVRVVAADVNGDGRLDLISANYSANSLTVLFSAATFNTGPLAVWGQLAAWGGLTVNSNIIFVAPNGTNVGINTTNPNPAAALDVHGLVTATGGFVQTSDERYKTNIATLRGALEKIMALRGVGYDWRREEFPDMNFNLGRQLGFIAQELAQVLPEAVSQDPQGHYAVAYSEVIPVLVEALKEEEQRTDVALKEKDAKINALENRLAELEKLAARLLETNSPPAPKSTIAPSP